VAPGDACARFEREWREGRRPRLEDFLAGAEGAEREALAGELLRVELDCRARAGEAPEAREYRQRFPGLDAVVEALFATVAEGVGGATQPSTGELPARAGRYRIEGEVARGGMGCVLRAFDPDLERSLAVKALLSKHRGSPEAERRFLEEARITGQLQHPAIPPVHEVGRLDDGRPYFAMKLIKGRTLAELLQERKAPADDLPRWLAAFAAVCQGVAYAHSKGVIHRDLKPGNIMIGAFGEAQVMDWGLAKALSGARQPPERSEEETAEASVIATRRGAEPSTWSQDGDVLGTPAYMAPEQARGEVDSLDERTDVFGLGAMLCVILTGEPPYRGGSRQEAQRQARRGDLSEAFARLDGCGADAELVALARSCLAPEQDGRPANAGEVAVALAAYQAALQKRLRAAELERAAAQVKAVEERKRRRLTLGLAAVLVVALALGAAGLVSRQQRRQRAREQAEAGLAQAVELRRGYRFADAESVLKQVRAWADQAVDRELQQRLARAEADLALARDLDDVRQKAAVVVEGKWGEALMREEAPGALARHGLDALGGDLEELAKAIRGSAVRADIVAALDDWARAEVDRERLQRALRLANGADEPDLWRRAVREALARGDEKRLRQLVRETGQGKATPGVVLLIARVFQRKSEIEGPTGLLRQMVLERPRDFWVNVNLGSRLLDQRKAQEAAECYRAAVASRPDSSVAHDNLGVALERQGRWLEAEKWHRKAIELGPTSALAHDNLGVVLERQGRLAEAEKHHRKAIELDPNYARAHDNLGVLLERQGKRSGAEKLHRKAIELGPSYAPAYDNLGVLLERRGKPAEAEKLHRKAIEFDPNYALAHDNLGVLLERQGKWAEAEKHHRRAIELSPRLAHAHDNLGVLLSRQGKWAEAEKGHRRAVELAPNFARAHYNLGVVLERKGKRAEAERLYRRAVELAPNYALAHDNLGVLLAQRGKLAEAEKHHRRAVELAPGHAGARYNLACWAALAACGKGDEAGKRTNSEKARLRAEALACLKATLALWSNRLDSGQAADRAAVQATMRHWQQDSDLAGIRDEAALARLPPQEREACRRLWADVAALLAQAGAK
jgi:serine/threonine-protein kinase